MGYGNWYVVHRGHGYSNQWTVCRLRYDVVEMLNGLKVTMQGPFRTREEARQASRERIVQCVPHEMRQDLAI